MRTGHLERLPLAIVIGGLATGAVLGGCHLVLGYESSYEETTPAEAQASTATGGCVCNPGDKEPCGSCGTKTCTDTCVWGACEGQGVCAPGTTKECDNGCGVRVCSDACTWCDCPAASCDDCEGIQAAWKGCRGNGCSVCVELLADYPCYFQNHPECVPNPTCEGQYFECGAKCPSPSPVDSCVCPSIGSTFWSGCEGSGCSVCGDVVKDYACYFIHHPLCKGPAACSDAPSTCNGDLCPAPSEADKGSLQ